ncbi:T-complex protein 11-like protein 1 [Frankliniella fusca]|uniref:T-complex protein 11-like protein 1 n=1 Tax=Frankliniella fusca TaxID=407009 RepID=A0AAE1HQJ5_9NEOP|nr:T-complex protein 11-like protein 1 [Frankliniella fusca]
MSDKDGAGKATPYQESKTTGNQGSTPGASQPTPMIPMPMNRSSPFVAVSGIASSPPQFVTMEEIMSAANGLENMKLAHEIVVDKDFKLQPYEPPENSLERKVKDAFHRAFWDLLAEELSEDPPVYKGAMILLEELKEILLDLLYPQHEKLKQEINEMLDIPFIKQQAENDALDFLGYAHSVLNVMGRICAPARDERIQELRGISDVVQVFKGVFETLTLMRLDLANFNIKLVQTNFMAQTIDYEKEQFEKLLSLQGGLGSLIFTKKWLKSGMEKAGERDIILTAYLDLFEWNQNVTFPETIALDDLRIQDLRNRLQRLIVQATVLLVTLSKANNKDLQQSSSFKENLMSHIGVLLQDVCDNETLKNSLPNVAEQVVCDIKHFMASKPLHDQPIQDSSFEESLKDLILEIHRPDHNVRRVIKQRTDEFLHAAFSSTASNLSVLPPGMTSVKSEFFSIIGSMIRLYQFNLAVHGGYYNQIIASLKEEVSAST